MNESQKVAERYEEKEVVTYHMNVFNENGQLVDLTNAEIVCVHPHHGVIEIRFNAPPSPVMNRVVCRYCGVNRPIEERTCSGCGAPDVG
jgi:hypothetical protein